MFAILDVGENGRLIEAHLPCLSIGRVSNC